MRFSRIPAVAILVFFAAVNASSVRADESANNIFRFGAGWLDPDGETTSGGASIDVDAAATFFVDYERRLIPWLGIDFQLSYAKPDVVATAGPVTATQSEATYSGTAGLNVHVLGRARFDLYLGAYAAYTEFDKAFDNATGYGAVAGFDIGITKSGLAITTAIRYTLMEADFQSGSGSADYDPLVYQLGLGWRF